MIYSSILESIGKTPLIELQKLTTGLNAHIFVKCESLNPGGSIKDRIALEIIEDAERKGVIKEGYTVIEATAGNTGIGLAMVCAVKGYKAIFVVPEKMSSEKINILRAFGAEVIVVPNAPPDSPDNYINYSSKLARELPNSFSAHQFNNLNNPEAHYKTTAREIYEDLDGNLNVFVAGVGTGGTISGCARYLKERNPHTYIIAADPAGSVLSGDTPRSYKVEGIGEDFVPKTLNAQLIDEFIRVSDEESFNTARRLAKEEGILAGGSSGTALAAAIRYARRSNKEENIVVILPDTGRNYLSKFYSDAWMNINGFSTNRIIITARDVLDSKPEKFKKLITLNIEKSIDEALKIMAENGISQLPVQETNKTIGMINEKTILFAIKSSTISISTRIRDIMSPLPPVFDLQTDLEDIKKVLFSSSDSILISENNEITNILTRIDLIRFLLRKGENYEI